MLTHIHKQTEEYTQRYNYIYN